MIMVDYIDSKNYKDYIGKTISVKGYVSMNSCNLVGKLPIKFVSVGSYFDCSNNNLTSLEGVPEEICGDFLCHNNNLTNLEGAPKEVGGDFNCSNNRLESLEGAPKNVGGDFWCANNDLTSLDVPTKYIGELLICEVNNYITDTMINILNERYRKLRMFMLF